MTYQHKPVLVEVLCDRVLRQVDRYVLDVTLGEGGHSFAFLQKGKTVFALEADEEILSIANERLQMFPTFFSQKRNFSQLTPQIFPEMMQFDLILFDLGISQYHLKVSQKGFSFLPQMEANLDMRLDDQVGFPCKEIINFWPEPKLAELFLQLGEESFSKRAAKAICAQRDQMDGGIQTSLQLANIVAASLPKRKIHPATKIFQALRMFVNQELPNLQQGLDSAIKLLSPEGKLCVISYHSLEDRLVKNFFQKQIPKRRNINKYKHISVEDSSFCLWSPAVIFPTREEILCNPSARSAKLRILQKKE